MSLVVPTGEAVAADTRNAGMIHLVCDCDEYRGLCGKRDNGGGRFMDGPVDCVVCEDIARAGRCPHCGGFWL